MSASVSLPSLLALVLSQSVCLSRRKRKIWSSAAKSLRLGMQGASSGSYSTLDFTWSHTWWLTDVSQITRDMGPTLPQLPLSVCLHSNAPGLSPPPSPSDSHSNPVVTGWSAGSWMLSSRPLVACSEGGVYICVCVRARGGGCIVGKRGAWRESAVDIINRPHAAAPNVSQWGEINRWSLPA